MGRKTVRIFFYLTIIASLILIIYQHNLLFGTFLLILAMVVYNVLVPPAFSETRDDKDNLFKPVDNPDAPIVLLLSSGGNLSQGNSEEEWINILKKECGFFSTKRLSQKFSLPETSAKLLVISNEALKEIALQPQLLKEIESLAINKGTTLFLESPDSSFEFLTGVVTGQEEYLYSDTLSICESPRELPVFPPLNVFLPFRSVLTTSDDSHTNLSSGKRCLMFYRKKGKGNIVSIFFPLSKWRRTIAFGVSDKTQSIGNKIQFLSKLKHFQSSDLSLLRSTKYQESPFLDILERFIVEKSAHIASIPLWWYYPQGKKTSVLTTFDEDYCGDEFRAILDKKIPQNIKPTIFLMSSTPTSEETIEETEKRKGDAGIHWNRFFLHLTGSGFHYERQRKLKAQIKNLSTKCKNIFLPLSRIHYLICDYNPFTTMGILNDAGIGVDSSWGPGRNMGGYSFGTGFPYHAPSERGKTLALLEFPFSVHDPHGNLTTDEIIRLISDSAEKYHSPVMLLFHPHYCIEGKESSARFDSVIKYIANKDELWNASVAEFTDFYEKRSKSKVICRQKGNILEIECDAEADGLSLNLPLPDDIIKIEVDDEEVSSVNISGRKIIVLKEGKHLIRIGYANE